MNDLRKAAEMALEALSKVMLTSDKGVACENARKVLRQALAQPDEVLAEREACAAIADIALLGAERMLRDRVLKAIRARSEKPPVKSYCGGKPNYCTPEVTPEVTTEVTGDVGACVTCGAPKGEWLVDAVNMSQERVDETAKREHEPVAWFVQYSDSHEFLWDKPKGWRVEQALEIQPLYTAPPKREWVGLTVDEARKFYEKYTDREELIYAIDEFLEDKNA